MSRKGFRPRSLILDGSSDHGAHIWIKSGISILLKAFGYIFFFGKDLFDFIYAQHVLSYHLIEVPCEEPRKEVKICTGFISINASPWYLY